MFSWVKTSVSYSKERRNYKLSENRGITLFALGKISLSLIHSKIRKPKVYINQTAWLPKDS